MRKHRQSLLLIASCLLWAGCQERIGLQEPEIAAVPEGEMAFCIGTDAVGEPLTRGMVSGADYTPVETLQLICFDQAGYFLGVRIAHPTPASGNNPTSGTFSGYVPENTARIHFVANVNLDLSDFAIGTAEKVIMRSKALSTDYTDDDPEVKFWGYHKEASASAMKTWLQYGRDHTLDVNHTVSLLRDRARIRLTVASTLYASGAWLNGSAGEGKKVTGLSWGINHGRERGYLAPYTPGDTPWDNYTNSVDMNEYEDCGRYTLEEDKLDVYDEEDPQGNYQYVYDDINMMTATENERVTIVLKVDYSNNDGTNARIKYLLAQLREGSGSNEEGEMIQITRNRTYVVNITNLSHDGYEDFSDAVDEDADDFANAPADVDKTVPYVSDGEHALYVKTVYDTDDTDKRNLIFRKPVVVARTENTFTVEFEYTKAPGESSYTPAPADFKIYWDERINKDWDYNDDLSITSTTSPNTYKGSFTVTIGSIGESYAFTDYLVIRHKKSGLTRYVHFYGIDQFRFRLTPVLEQVLLDENGDEILVLPYHGDFTPYLGPSGDEVGRPVFRLSFSLSQSMDEDLFPTDVRMATSTLLPYGDGSGSYTSRLPGRFSVQNAPTDKAYDGTALVASTNTSDGVLHSPSSSVKTDWNYLSNNWKYWYGYTLDEFPRTVDVRDGKVVIYLKDVRDAYAQASGQSVGLILDVENYEPWYLFVDAADIWYRLFEYNSETHESVTISGVYDVGNKANKYRAIITGCPAGSYTLSKQSTSSTDWLTVDPGPVEVTSDGKLDFKFSVTDNTSSGAVARSATIVFTDGTNTTRVIVNQAGVVSLRLTASSTSVIGNTREVSITVYSDSPWTLNTTGGTLSSTSGYATGTAGVTVKLSMPINYSTSDIVYTITADNDDNATASIDITQRKATLTNETISFTADNDFRSRNVETQAGIKAEMSDHTLSGNSFSTILGDPNPYRWDFKAATNTLELTRSDESVMQIRGVVFVFHAALVPYETDYVPNSISVSVTDPAGTVPASVSPGTGSATDRTTWTWNQSGAPVKDATFTLVKGSEIIALKNFTVYITRASWK